MSKLLSCIKNSDRISFYGKHPILIDLATILSRGLNYVNSYTENANIFVGAHEWINDQLPDGFNIGIQTEHFHDEGGTKLWNCPSYPSRLKMYLKFDAIIDINPNNSKFYKRLHYFLPKNVIIGPYIFPDHQPNYNEPSSSDLLFVGVINKRREEFINTISRNTNVTIKNNALYDELNSFLLSHQAILNLHFQSGIYSEWPRLLLAYMSGKVLASETLGRPLKASKHYIHISDINSNNDYEVVFNNLKNEIAISFKLSTALNILLNKSKLEIY